MVKYINNFLHLKSCLFKILKYSEMNKWNLDIKLILKPYVYYHHLYTPVYMFSIVIIII